MFLVQIHITSLWWEIQKLFNICIFSSKIKHSFAARVELSGSMKVSHFKPKNLYFVSPAPSTQSEKRAKGTCKMDSVLCLSLTLQLMVHTHTCIGSPMRRVPVEALPASSLSLAALHTCSCTVDPHEAARTALFYVPFLGAQSCSKAAPYFMCP